MPTLKLLEKRTYPKELQARIDALWEQECQQKPNLYDGEVLEFVEFKDETLTVRKSSYRFYFAALKGELDLWICGVTALVQCKGRYLVGKRSQNVMHPGLWEFAPAGTLEGLDPEKTLLEEMKEELLIPEEDVALVSFLTTAFDRKLKSFDLCYRILLKKASGSTSPEYEELRWLDPKEILHFNEPHSDLFLELKKFV